MWTILLLIGFFETGSIGFSGDPLINGVSIVAGKKEGFRTHLIFSFGSGEIGVDSSYYYHQDPARNVEYHFYRPYFWINWGIRGEYHFKNYNWYQPYIALGLEGKRDFSWATESFYYDSMTFIKPIQTKTIFLGPVMTAGLTFYPIKMLSGLDVPFAKVLALNIEMVAFYLIKRQFDPAFNYPLGIVFYNSRRYSGIDIGAGIYYHW
ncbi:MAG: hypothetical protein NZ601_00485 [candidate division WOR-3 bacterium]|nr:hypothetical protein [candidate division WOR-3 bacterium]MCX7757969.1 hypothetical protein [candidate division WOR-3 bacterium]MDW7987225.1 hypothetical protein [candidate division WOR-3 bacterium]